MRIILSRKGFDSATGGVPSPVYEDRAFLSLPIPEPLALGTGAPYDELEAGGTSLGRIMQGLTGGAVVGSALVHLDPDLRAGARARSPGWRPAFGQAGAAQTHLANQGVGPGDLFLFFGWFRLAENARGQHRFRAGAPDVHARFGWLQVGAIHPAGPGSALPGWAAMHPHAAHAYAAPNVLYTARETLQVPGVPSDAPGAGAFERLHDDLVLTADAGRRRRSLWRLPRCFLPEGGAPTLTYNTGAARWQPDPASADHVLLRAAGRGQEFVLNAEACAGAAEWAAGLVARHGPPPTAVRGRRVLLAVRELHRLGYERLRIAPGLSPAGTAWRVAVVPAPETCAENGALTPPGPLPEATYSTGDGGRYFGWDDAAGDAPADLAAKFVARFPRVAAPGRGPDPAYRLWYEEMLAATAPMGLPYAYWDSYGDWELGMTHLRTTAGGPVPVPPPGGARYQVRS